MKVYTEVNYIWKDDKLVQTDSQSFDYEGEVEQCHTKTHTILGRKINSPHSHGTGSTEVSNLSEAATTNMKSVNLDKPGGDVKRFTDWTAKLDHEAQMIAWGHSSYNKKSDDPNTTDAEELLKGSRRGNQGKGKMGKTKEDDLRRTPYAMKSDTLLTQGKYAKKVGPQ